MMRELRRDVLPLWSSLIGLTACFEDNASELREKSKHIDMKAFLVVVVLVLVKDAWVKANKFDIQDIL